MIIKNIMGYSVHIKLSFLKAGPPKNRRFFGVVILFVATITMAIIISCSEKKVQMPNVIEVSTITVKTKKVVLSTKLPARTAPLRIAEIRPQVSGVILKRLFTEGTDVKAGEILYQIDPAPFEAALNSAIASLDKAKAFLPTARLRAERYKALLANNAISKQEYDDAFATLNQAIADIEYWKANVETARINLGYCKITAPISGRIGRSLVTEGATVTAYQSMALATIQQLDPIYVDVPQSTTELLLLKRRLEEGRLHYEGKTQNNVKLILEDGSSYPLEGTLQFQDITVDPSTGSVILRVIFPNPHHILLPGMFVQAIIREGINNNAILVPQECVFRDYKGNPLAYIVNTKNIVEKHMLTLDRAIGNYWLVAAGLSVGDRVIIEGKQRVQQGVRVKVLSPEEDNMTKRSLTPDNITHVK